MATLAELLASSLAALKQVQQSGDFTIVKSGELSPTHLKRLLANHFLMPVIKGWYIVTDPRAVPGDSMVRFVLELHPALCHGALRKGVVPLGRTVAGDLQRFHDRSETGTDTLPKG